MARLRGVLACVASLTLLYGCSDRTETPEGDPTGVISQRWTAPACGAVMATWDGTSAKSNGVDTGTGSSCAGTGTYGLQYQCVELVMRHFKTHWGLRWYGNAKDLLAHAKTASYFASGSPSDVAVYNNGDAAHPPVPGDMIIWTSGTYGHVALVTAVTASKVAIMEQNVTGVTPPGTFSLGFDGKTVAGRWGGVGPAGWVHAKANVGTTPPSDAGSDAAPPKDSGAPVDATPADAVVPEDDGGPLDEAGVGDPIGPPPDSGDASTSAADDTGLTGSCAYGTKDSNESFTVALLVALAIASRRRRARD